MEIQPKYWYVINDGHSYRLEAIISNIAAICYHRQTAIQSDDTNTSEYQFINETVEYTLLHGGKINVNIYMGFKSATENLLDVLQRATRKCLLNSKQLIPDWSLSSGQTECSLTQDTFMDPYILNLTGRTYSKEAIVIAIKSSLLVGRDLRLEDRTFTYHNLDTLRLYPNLSLVMSDKAFIKFDVNEVTVPSYNHILVNKENIEEFSEWLGNVGHTNDDIWDGPDLYRKYAKIREIPLNPVDDIYVVSNIRVRGIMMFKYHPKMDRGKFIFHNVEFIQCNLDAYCLCGVEFTACRFFECDINVYTMSCTAKFNGSEFIRCVFWKKLALTTILEHDGVIRIDKTSIENGFSKVKSVTNSRTDMDPTHPYCKTLKLTSVLQKYGISAKNIRELADMVNKHSNREDILIESNKLE